MGKLCTTFIAAAMAAVSAGDRRNHLRGARTDAMPRDFDVQVRSGGAWRTVREVRDNFRRFLDIRFAEPVAGDACRVVWLRPWGGAGNHRVFSFEVF